MDVFPYERATLFTPAERSFLGVLDLALGPQFRVMGKVRLADVIRVKSGTDRGSWWTAFNRTNEKHVDFVVCTATDMRIQCVVELDDASHGRKRRRDRDEFIDKALAAASIPVVRFAAKRSYSPDEIRAAVAERAPLRSQA